MFRPVSVRIKNLMTHKDTFYVFNQGTPQLIYGENKDDPGQRGNGSGKSGFIEAIRFATTGNFIRDGVRDRDMIMDGEDELEVQMIYYNTKNQKTLDITRNVFRSEHKSQLCKVIYGDEDIAKHISRVTDYGPWVLKEIGISEEDFKTYYVITSEDYKPFFGLTDLNKKGIINRFSGADKVDAVDPFIKKDSECKSEEIKKLEENIRTQNSLIEVHNQQLEQIKKQITQEFKDSLIEGKKRTIILNNSIVQKIEESLITLYFEEEKLVQKVKELKLKLNEEEKSVKDSLILTNISDLNEVRDLRQKASTEFIAKRVSLKNERIAEETKLSTIKSVKLKGQKTELIKLEQKVESSITCPECDHKFILREEDFDLTECTKVTIPELKTSIEETEALIKEYDLIISGIDLKLKDLDEEEKNKLQVFVDKKEELERVREGLDKWIQDFRLRKSDLQVKVLDLETAKKRVEQKELEFLVKNTENEVLEKEILDIQNNNTIDTSYVDEKILLCNERISDYEKEKEVKVKEKTDIDAWLINFKNFKSELANKSIKNIQDYTSLYLKAFGTNLSVKLEGYRLLPDGKIKEEITTTILRDGFEVGKYGRFSLGERTRIDLANIIGQQELININAKNGLDLLICDDILNGFDSLGIELIMNSILNLGKTIFIVSQYEVNSLKKNTLHFIKEDKQTKVVSH